MLMFFANHVWQSTIFAAGAWLLTLALRRNEARMRHAVWLAASIKCLVPFALLIALGQQIASRAAVEPPHGAPSAIASAVSAASQPFSQPLNIELAPLTAPDSIRSRSSVPFALVAMWAVGALAILAGWRRRWRRVSAIVRASVPVSSGREAAAVARAAEGAGLRQPPAVALSDAALEPGIFGVFQPVLLWPRGISEHLADAELDAIAAHEASHVSRRDNVWASIHMLVETIFWFHPLVWWIGARLVDERERACDEAVLALGAQSHTYAESILKTCEFSIASPLACVSGVTGSDLKRRIERIVRGGASEALTAVQILLIASLGTLATAVPFVIGFGVPQRLLAQAAVVQQDGPAFEAATIRPNNSGGRGSRGNIAGGRYVLTNMTPFALIQQAYGIRDIQVINAPGWMKTEHFDISAIGAEKATIDERRSMWRRLLEDRFALKVHHETRTLPAANLVLARADGKLGPHLIRGTEADADCKSAETLAHDFSKGPPPCSQMYSVGQMRARGMTMESFAQALTNGRSGFSFVFDETHLDGVFNIDQFHYRPDGLAPTPPPDWDLTIAPWPSEDEPSLFTALEEQLGLKLVPIRGPMDVIVIDSIEKPRPD